MNGRKEHATSYRVVLIALSVLGIGTGLLGDWLLPGIICAIPGWSVAGLVAAIDLFVASALREHRSVNQHYQLTGELESTKLDLDGVRRVLAGRQDQLDAIPDSSVVVTVICVLQGLLGLNIDFGQGYLFGEPRPSVSSS
jgi:hypothetical protein